MNDKMQRLRCDLTEAFAQPNWPPGYRVRTFTANDAAAVYHLLDVGYAQGGGASRIPGAPRRAISKP